MKKKSNRLFEVFQHVTGVKINDGDLDYMHVSDAEPTHNNQISPIGSEIGDIDENKIKIGQKYQITDGSGIDSNKIVTIIQPSEIKIDGSGKPINVQGAYKPVDWKREVAIKYENGDIGLMFKNHLIPVENEFPINVAEIKKLNNQKKEKAVWDKHKEKIDMENAKMPEPTRF